VTRGDVSTEEKVRFLSEPAAYAHAPADVLVTETHMSWVFLAGGRVFKLKKPVRYPFLDFTGLTAREVNCREEVRLNRRLAPDTYLGVLELTQEADGSLALGGAGRIVDWLVVMRRLPAERMLDLQLAAGSVGEPELDRLGDVLARFYDRADRPALGSARYVERFVRQQAENRAVLTRRNFAVDHGRIPELLAQFDARLAADRGLLEERVRQGHIVDGHGDLRPEHICLSEPIVIFDCLEFSRDLRLVDPFDELAFLGLECRLLGAPSIGPALMARLADRLGDHPPQRVVNLYTAFRALLRARLSLAHLLDPVPREPAKWEPLASRYLALAGESLR
jgi:aminoglycoside phosphotransferase family enzyme